MSDQDERGKEVEQYFFNDPEKGKRVLERQEREAEEQRAKERKEKARSQRERREL